METSTHSAKPINIGDLWHRFTDVAYSITIDADRERYGTRYEIEHSKLLVEKITPKGVWLVPQGFGSISTPRHFVRLASRKKFAHPTELEALESYQARKKAQISLLATRIGRAQAMLDRADACIAKITGNSTTKSAHLLDIE